MYKRKTISKSGVGTEKKAGRRSSCDQWTQQDQEHLEKVYHYHCVLENPVDVNDLHKWKRHDYENDYKFKNLRYKRFVDLCRYADPETIKKQSMEVEDNVNSSDS